MSRSTHPVVLFLLVLFTTLSLVACGGADANPDDDPGGDSWGLDEEPGDAEGEEGEEGEEAEPLPVYCPAESEDFQYVSEEYDVCLTIFYGCPEGFEYYDDPDCGCGCIRGEAEEAEEEEEAEETEEEEAEPLPVYCPAESEDFYYVEKDYGTCMVIFYSCPEDFSYYDDPDCGCGCVR